MSVGQKSAHPTWTTWTKLTDWTTLTTLTTLTWRWTSWTSCTNWTSWTTLTNRTTLITLDQRFITKIIIEFALFTWLSFIYRFLDQWSFWCLGVTCKACLLFFYLQTLSHIQSKLLRRQIQSVRERSRYQIWWIFGKCQRVGAGGGRGGPFSI